jgi:hypothetical protein
MTSSLVFVARFTDGETVRMTCHCPPEKPDLKRGVKLAQSAYLTRARNRLHNEAETTQVAVPNIVEARFEANGAVLVQYDEKQLAEASP